MRTEQRDDGVLYAVAGASRSGKTAWVKSKVRPAKRSVIWDTRGEYVSEPGFRVVKTPRELSAAMIEAGTGPARLAYWGALSDFPVWCQMAYLWGQLWPAVIVAEEISDVTNPGKAPAGWGELIRKGLFYGNHIYSVTQRPAECDKTVWGNATCIHSHRFVLPIDQEYMGKFLGLPPAVIGEIKPLHYVERWAGQDALKYGSVKI